MDKAGLILKKAFSECVLAKYNANFPVSDVIVNETPDEFVGDFTIVIFPIVKLARKKPEEAAAEIGEELIKKVSFIESYNVIKGFLNLVLKDSYWKEFLNKEYNAEGYGIFAPDGTEEAVEYCGPNTNKPLHLGHIRNMLIGWSIIKILEANGKKIQKLNIYNDRGIAICKSMVAWLHKGEGKKPSDTGEKGDHFVGRFYVLFDKMLKPQIQELIDKGMPEEEAKKEAPLMKEAYDLLRKWELGDDETMSIWQQMNDWVYSGYEETFKTIGISFDRHYYESETYLLGKEIVKEGLANGSLIKKEDGSVWVDLTDEGLDEKILLRKDGTSVYVTQDLGTAEQRFSHFPIKRCIYVVANEQDYHFKVLQKTLAKIGKKYAEGIYHLSYGMVDLPEGKMKSREGTVVDADDLLQEMFQTAENYTRELGKLDDFDNNEAQKLYKILGLGALKFFILRVDPKKRMLFNPQESIDFQGQTGPFVQYTFARIQSVLRKEKPQQANLLNDYKPADRERKLLRLLYLYPEKVSEAGANLDPSVICHYAYTLAKEFNGFYSAFSILNAENEDAKQFRLALSEFTAQVLKKSFDLLGIEMPYKM
ncbi:MAG: arginine--tRNA ligase [Chitinophagaceae bacterium]|nr:MAG: arginine--tRNA ligase [Chitinophagaceae bacterium]